MRFLLILALMVGTANAHVLCPVPDVGAVGDTDVPERCVTVREAVAPGALEIKLPGSEHATLRIEGCHIGPLKLFDNEGKAAFALRGGEDYPAGCGARTIRKRMRR